MIGTSFEIFFDNIHPIVDMSQKILIIEDESSIADNISYVLEAEGFDPIWCATAIDGKTVLENSNISLIILDIGLPDINGFEFCKEIRKISDIPVIFLTARADELDRIVGLEIGADDYVTKPFSPRELAARVKTVLRRYNSSSSRINHQKIKIPFNVNEEKREISYYGQALPLSKYEYNILRSMLQHPGRIFSRRQLMNIAWEEPDTSMERTIDTHIKTIRAKLKTINPDKEPIVTHRGFGYSITERL